MSSSARVDADDATAVRRLHAELLEAWNRRDAAGYARRFAPDGSIVGFDGSIVTGPAAIEQHLGRIFADHTPAAYVALVREVRSIGPGATLLRADAGMIPPGETAIKPERNAVQALVAQRHGDTWLAELFQNTPAAFHGRPDAVRALTAELQRAADAS